MSTTKRTVDRSIPNTVRRGISMTAPHPTAVRGEDPGSPGIHPEYKLGILAEYDRCTESGEQGPCCGVKASTRA